jgi:hypothetical protein
MPPILTRILRGPWRFPRLSRLKEFRMLVLDSAIGLSATMIGFTGGATVAPPTAIASIADQAWTLGQTIAPLEVGAAFAGESLTFAATGLPNGLRIDPATGAIVGAPEETVVERSVMVAAANPAGEAFSGFLASVAPALAAPTATLATWSAVDGRRVTIEAGAAAGEPAPTASLALALDGQTVSATGSGPWTYDAPSSASVSSLTWTVTWSNGVSPDALSGGSREIAPDLFAPTAAGRLADLTLTQGVAMTSVDVSQDFAGTAPITYAPAPSSAALPAGLTLSAEGLVTGTPIEAAVARSIVIRATNAHGFADSAFSLTVAAAEAEKSLTDDAAVLAAALDAPVAGLLTLAPSWTASRPQLLDLASLTGETTATVIGATDFVAASPTMPSDLDAVVNHGPGFTTSTGVVVARRSHVGPNTHPRYGDNQGFAFGPEIDPGFAGHPFDYVGGVAKGLKIYDPISGLGDNAVAYRNGLRHRGAAHDGHIVWLAEAEMQDGSIRTFASEVYTRATSPIWSPPVEMMDPANPAIWLRKLVTLRVAPYAVDDASIRPSRWALQPKRLRADYTPAATFSTWSAFTAHLAALTDTALENGTIAALAPGQDYVIALAPGVYQDTAESTRRAVIRDAASAGLSGLTRHRVFVIGTPGETVVHALTLWVNTRNIDFGWITFRPATFTQANGTRIATESNALLNIHKQAEARFFGCVVDGVDGAWFQGVQMGGGLIGPEYTQGSRIEFYDGYIGGVKQGVGAIAPQFANGAYTTNAFAGERVIFARTLFDVSNDPFQINGPVRLRLESNRMFGGGGFKTSNEVMQHRDKFLQHQNTSNPMFSALAAYHNLSDSGRASLGMATPRGYSQTMIVDDVRWDEFDLAWNIFEQEPGGARGVGFVNRPRKFGATGAYFNFGSMAYNLFVPRPDLMATAWHPFMGEWASYVTGAGTSRTDGLSATHNLLQQHVSTNALPMGLDRQVEFFPDWQGGDRAAIPTPTEAFDGPITYTGDMASGYVPDYSLTTFAGTSREGWIAAADYAAKTPLASVEGGGPGFLTAAQQAGKFTDIPADLNAHLGWNVAGSTLPADLFGAWTNGGAAFALAGSFANPWRAGANDFQMLVNARITAVGQGKLIEEVAADGSLWRLEVGADARVTFTILGPTASGAPVLYRATSRETVKAGSHLAFQVDTRWDIISHEAVWLRSIPARLIGDHVASAAGGTRAILWTAQASAPAAPGATPGIVATHVWYDTSAGNRVRVWNGAAWDDAQGDLSDWLHALAVTIQTGTVPSGNRPISDYAIRPAGRVLLAETTAALTVAPQANDFLRTLEGLQPSIRRWSGSAWVGATTDTRVLNERGWVQAWFVIDGGQPLILGDWIIRNAGRVDVPLPRGTVTLGGYTGTVGWFEAYRGDVAGLDALPRGNGHTRTEIAHLSLANLLRRAPADPVTGQRWSLWQAPDVRMVGR